MLLWCLSVGWFLSPNAAVSFGTLEVVESAL